MDVEKFYTTLTDDEPPSGLPESVRALCYDFNNDWNKAHITAQSVGTSDGSWVHAYLHRKEGDFRNADYWYSNASKTRPEITLEKERENILIELLRLASK